MTRESEGVDMKKLTCVILIALAIIALVACGKAPAPTMSSSGTGGKRLYILSDRGEGQMYYKVLELHPEPDFDGADEAMDEKYLDYILRCQLGGNEYDAWTNADAEEFLQGKAYRFEREYTASQLAKFNELGLTSAKLHTLLNASFGVEDIMTLTADRVSEMFDKGEWDGE